MQPDMKTLLAGARSLVKTAVANPRPTSADLGLDMDSMGGRLADYSGTSWGGSRAGRASHLSDAMGYEPEATVRHPLTHDLLHTLTGGGIGALLGGGMGYAGSKLLGKPQHHTNDIAGSGALIGGVVGGLNGLLGGRADRRTQMQAIADTYDAGADTDPSVRPRGAHAGITSLLTPFGGAHRSGQTDIYEALNNKGRGPGGNTVSNGVLRNLANVLQLTPMGPASVMGTGTAQTISAAMRAQSVDRKRRLQAKQQRTNATQEDIQKAAADAGMLQQLLDGGRSLVSKVDLKNPMHTGAIGAGAGALGGLASGAMSDEEEPGYTQRALMGGLAGGGLGAGAGALNAKYNPAAQPGPPKTPKLVPPAIGSPEQMANNNKLEDVIHAWGLNPPNTGPSGFKPGYLPGTRPAGIVNNYYPGQTSIEAQMHPTDDGSGYNQPWSKDPHHVKQYTDPNNPRRPAIPEILKRLGLPPN